MKKISAVLILLMFLISIFVPLFKMLPVKAIDGTANYVYRTDFTISNDNFSFSEYIYVGNLNFTYRDENLLLVTIIGDSEYYLTLKVYLFKNETGSFLLGENNFGDSGEMNCSLYTWHFIYYEVIYGDGISWSFQIDGIELFSNSVSEGNYQFYYLQIGASSEDYTGGNYQVYFDDLNWTAGVDDFESDFPDGWSVVGNATLSTNQYYSASHSLISAPTIYEAVNTISRGDFEVLASDNFSFSVEFYCQYFNTLYEADGYYIQIIRIQTNTTEYVNVNLYKNSSGTYIFAEDNIGEYSWGGYQQCSWESWYTILYYCQYNGSNYFEQFQVDDNILFNETFSSSYSFTFNFIKLGVFGVAASNYTFYFDDVHWTVGSDDFEGSFPNGWSTTGYVGLSDVTAYSPTHSLIVPSAELPPLSVYVTPEVISVNRNSTQTFTVTTSGGTPPYTYSWYVNGSPAMRESGIELLTNGDFETGDLTGWQHNVYASVTTTFVHSGMYACLIIDGGDQGYIRQTFAGVPQDKIISIGFWQRSVGFGQLGLVTIEYSDETTTVVEANTTGYTWEYVDLLPYVEVGKTVTALNFTHNGVASSHLFVDDISLIPSELPETGQTFNFRTESLGFYEIWCNVTDSTNTTVKSNVANCTVEAGSLEITVSPSDITLDLGEYENASASVVGGTPPLQYQWYRNGTAVGTNSSSYEVNATQWGVGVWSLHCNVTDANSIENKSNVIYVYISEGVLTVDISPTGTVNKYLGQQTSFTSSVSGGIPPYTYEWYVNNELKGTSNTYNLLPNSTGNYAVKLKVYDSGITSQWSSTTTVVVSYPTVSLVPTSASTRINIGKTYTCTVTPSGLGNYTFFWYKNGESVYNSTEGTTNINQYTFVPTESGIYELYVSVRFTTLIDPYERSSNNVTLYVFGTVQRTPATVAHLTTSGVDIPIGHPAQASAFSAHGYYWQFYYDGYISEGLANGYIRYKYSMDTQMWVEPAGSPFSGARILASIPFSLYNVVHGWGGGVPFTLYYDNSSEILYLVYSYGYFTVPRSLMMVTATLNEDAIDWDWGTPETIVTYDYPRLPVCPSLILASNGNPFVTFLLSRGVAGGALYHRIFAYYNGTNWNVYPAGDPSIWYDSVPLLKLFNVGTKVYYAGFDPWFTVGYFDTATETYTSEWQVGYQMMIPNDSEIWNLASFIDNVRLVARARVDGILLSGEVVELHLDVYNGTQWFCDVASGDPDWLFYSIEVGEYITGSKYISAYLPTDRNLRKCRVRFWFTNTYPRPITCTIDKVYLELENSFGYVIETVPVVNYTESHDIGRTWQTLHIDGFTGEQSDWTKVGTSPYLDEYDDGSYITTTTPLANDTAYTFQDLNISGGTVHGAYLYMHVISEIYPNNYVDVYIYDGYSWHYVAAYPIGDPRYWYVDVTSILNTFDKVDNAALQFVHRNVGANFTIDYAELIVDYDYSEFPNNWVVSGNPPYLDTEGSGNVSVTQSADSIFCVNTEQWKGKPVPNMISYFNFTNAFTTITHSVNATDPVYIYRYLVKDVTFQSSPNGYLSAFLVAGTYQTLIREDAGFTNMGYRHNRLGTWEDTGTWWNYTLWYMNLTTSIDNVFDAKVVGFRAGFSSLYIFWNETLGDYQYEWVNQTDGLYWGTKLASSVTLDGTPLEFHFYDKSMYVTRYNGRTWNILKFLDENYTILRMNYGEHRCFTYVVQPTSYDVKFIMPFIKVTVKAETQDGTPLSEVGVIMNGELIYTPYVNNYDIAGSYSVTLYPAHIYFTSDDIPYAFIYYLVEASPAVKYETSYFETTATEDMLITIVYAIGIALIPLEVTPAPSPEIIYCLPLVFYIIMTVLFMFGLYLFYRKEEWKMSIPLIPVILWLILFEPKTPIDEMPIIFLRYLTVPPWHLYMGLILTVVVAVLLLSKR